MHVPNLLFALAALQIGSVYGPFGGNKKIHLTFDDIATKTEEKPTSESHGSAHGETLVFFGDPNEDPEKPAKGKTVSQCVNTALTSSGTDGTQCCLDDYAAILPSKEKKKLFCKLHVYVSCRLAANVNEYIMKNQKGLEVTGKDGVKYTLSDLRYSEINFKTGFGALGIQNEPGVWKNEYSYYSSNGYVKMAGRATFQKDGTTTTKPFEAQIDYGSGYQAITAGPLLYSEKHSPQLYVDREGCEETKKAKKVDVVRKSALLADGSLRQRMVSDIYAVLGDTYTEAINDAPNLFDDDKEKELLKKLAKKVKS